MRYQLAFVVALVAGGCGLADFDVTETVAPQTIPGSSTGLVTDASLFDASTSISWDDLPHGKSWADALTLRSGTFEIVAPTAGTFDFVDSVKLSISSPSTSALPEAEVAAGQITAGSNQMQLTPTGVVNLLPYVKAGAVLRATGTGKQPVDTTTFQGKVIITVHL